MERTWLRDIFNFSLKPLDLKGIGAMRQCVAFIDIYECSSLEEKEILQKWPHLCAKISESIARLKLMDHQTTNL
jgi:hypothetical protein